MTTTTSRPASERSIPTGGPLGGTKDTQQAREAANSIVLTPAGADSRPVILEPVPIPVALGGTELRQATTHAATNDAPPVGSTPHPTSAESAPEGPASDGAQLTRDQGTNDGQRTTVTGAQLASGHSRCGAQTSSAAGAQQADRHLFADAQKGAAVGSTSEPDPAANVRAATSDVSLLDPALALAADVLDDIERVRTANENRLRALTRSEADSDGEIRGFGLDESHPDVARLAAMVETLKKVEHDAVLNLQRKMRAHPLGPWAKAQRGIGEKQIARLLAAIGDPYWRPEIVKDDSTVIPEGPRTVSALWAYCGLHVVPGQVDDGTQVLHAGEVSGPGQSCPDIRTGSAGAAPKRRRGERANWSTKAKTRAYLIATSCLKQLDSHCRAGQERADSHPGHAGPAVRHLEGCPCSPYRVVYDERRAHTAVTRPDWTDGHSHNDALRVASKAILRDLWREAKRLHEHSVSQTTVDALSRRAGGANT